MEIFFTPFQKNIFVKNEKKFLYLFEKISYTYSKEINFDQKNNLQLLKLNCFK